MLINKKLLPVFSLFLIAVLFTFFEIYIPKSFGQNPTVVYSLRKGIGYDNIGGELKDKGTIKSSLFFNLYVIISMQYSKLQAGKYELSPSMSIAKIVKKFVLGEVIKNNITIIEGWNIKDIAQYLEDKSFYSAEDFLELTKKDWSRDLEFLKDKPKNLSLEGYIFPDTYEISIGQKPEELLKKVLDNFNKKLTPDLRKEISLQHKSIFKIITMASILEKEVRTRDDKKIVSGILWKRLANDIPLQVDSTVNYITGKNDVSVSIKDTKIDSPYNTYKYLGLPLGPISNPGMDSILAALYPKKSDYWYYLSASISGKTIFSKTLEEHNLAKIEYLK